MSRTIAWGSPGRYIQGPDEIYHLPIHTKKYGSRMFAVIDGFFYQKLNEELTALYQKYRAEFHSSPSASEITEASIIRLTDEAKKTSPDAIIGIGGGKSLDTAKAVADNLKLPVVIIPTSASTDAPTSAMSIIYTEQHEHLRARYYTKNPDLVLVDTQILADAPVRFLVSGMGDALATVYEARATVRSDSPNYICQDTGSYHGTRTAMAICEECRRTILEYGVQAKLANELHLVTQALEAVVEANTLMSGLGFENVGCAGSHVICNGITAVPGGEKALHGEKVAFGILCQLLAEKASHKELEELMDFYDSVGLPLTLQDMGVENSAENIRRIAAGTQETEWLREPFTVTDRDIEAIVKMADALGQQYYQKHH